MRFRSNDPAAAIQVESILAGLRRRLLDKSKDWEIDYDPADGPNVLVVSIRPKPAVGGTSLTRSMETPLYGPMSTAAATSATDGARVVTPGYGQLAPGYGQR